MRKQFFLALILVVACMGGACSRSAILVLDPASRLWLEANGGADQWKTVAGRNGFSLTFLDLNQNSPFAAQIDQALKPSAARQAIWFFSPLIGHDATALQLKEPKTLFFL